MTLLHRFVRKLHWLEDAILVILFVALTGLAFAQIAMRNFLGGGLLWADSATRILVLWLALWGASIAGRNGKHIRIEFAIHYLPASWQRSILVICDFSCAVITSMVAYYSIVFVWNEYHYGDIAFLGVPVWVCESIIPIAFTLLALRFLVQSIAMALHAEENLT